MTNINAIVKTLKESGEDFEFYPTTDEMIEAVINSIETGTHGKINFNGEEKRFPILNYLPCTAKVMEIGAGTGKFLERCKESQPDWEYYAIEKARILLKGLMEKGFSIVGTDFNECQLLDKKADVIFCNPPYSDYTKWARRIITESDAKLIYLVIPSRWVRNFDILKALRQTHSEHDVIWSGDFQEAEREARAKVDILLIKRFHQNKNDAFNSWFDSNFQPEREQEKEPTLEERTENLSGQIATAENKIELIVDGYNKELERLVKNYKAVCSLDSELLKEIGLTKKSLQESFRLKIEGLKTLYWKSIFHQFDEITSRLTWENREKLRKRFCENNAVDITAGNIYAAVLFVCQNCNQFFDEQILTLFKRLSDEKNVIPYKSNRKVFEEEKHRWEWKNFNDKKSEWILDYRIIASSSVFVSDWSYDGDKFYNNMGLKDLVAIARSMGFTITKVPEPKNPGIKFYVYSGENVFCEFIVYKNHNIHMKLNKKFVLAISVYVGRRLGWIKNKQDIVENFPDELIQDACEYFDYNAAVTFSDCKLIGKI